jgi:hypothetical protein
LHRESSRRAHVDSGRGYRRSITVIENKPFQSREKTEWLRTHSHSIGRKWRIRRRNNGDLGIMRGWRAKWKSAGGLSDKASACSRCLASFGRSRIVLYHADGAGLTWARSACRRSISKRPSTRGSARSANCYPHDPTRRWSLRGASSRQDQQQSMRERWLPPEDSFRMKSRVHANRYSRSIRSRETVAKLDSAVSTASSASRGRTIVRKSSRRNSPTLRSPSLSPVQLPCRERPSWRRSRTNQSGQKREKSRK